MSWSIGPIIGKPEAVAAELAKIPETFTDPQSKLEATDALEHVIGIVTQNFGDESIVLKVTASGHSYAVNGEQKNRHCSANVEYFYGTLV